MAKFSLYFDGSCWPNPGGVGAYGYALLKSGEEQPIETGHGVIGTGDGITNNMTEFFSCFQGLGAFIRRTHEASETNHQIHHLSVYGDSKLVINIMNHHWHAKSEKAYYNAYRNTVKLLQDLRRSGHLVTFDWIPREQNTLCDDLSKAHNQKD